MIKKTYFILILPIILSLVFLSNLTKLFVAILTLDKQGTNETIDEFKTLRFSDSILKVW